MIRIRINAICFTTLAFVLSLSPTLSAQSPTVVSPDGQVVVTLDLQDGVPSWALRFGDTTVIEPGRLGIQVEGDPLGKLEAVSSEASSHDETVSTVWGKVAEHDNRYNELAWSLREGVAPHRTLRVTVRVFNDAVAVRYEFPENGGWPDEFRLADGGTEFRFADDGTGWAYKREHDPVGPQPLSQFHDQNGVDLPLTVQVAEDVYLGILEAAIFDIAPFRLKPISGGKTAFRESFPPSTLTPGDATSWRVVLLGRQPGDLLVSSAVYCLNPPCAIDDTSWITPGRAFWDWRAWGAKTNDGFAYGLDMASWRRFVDFASESNIRYLVLDANWYGPEFEASSDPRVSRDHMITQTDMAKPKIVRTPAPDDWADPIDVPALIRYGKQRNVGIILYINDIARFNYPFEETLALYQKWGAAGIKYGFMKGKGQQKVRETREIVRLCAKYHLLCNFHDGPVPPSGDRRTYPNYVTREFCHSQSDALRVFSPTGFCEQVFVNMLAGPLDMCNGLYALNNPAKGRPRIFTNVEATAVAETARTVITFSGFSILPDCPEAYAEKNDLFEFLRKAPMTWDETRILHSSIGQYITTARRSGDAWFIASATNEEQRTLPITLDFLRQGQSYQATLYEDAPDSHFQTNREAYTVRQIGVDHQTTLSATMAPGGGHCVWVRPR